MNKAKIAITVSPLVLSRLYAWVQSEHFASRSEAIEKAVEAQLQRLERTRLSGQCALLDVAEEQVMADMGLAADLFTSRSLRCKLRRLHLSSYIFSMKSGSSQ